MGEIRRLHERLASRQPGAFRTKKSFFRDFDKVQKMALSSLCLVDFTSFCSMSIMAPFFPKEVRPARLLPIPCSRVTLVDATLLPVPGVHEGVVGNHVRTGVQFLRSSDIRKLSANRQNRKSVSLYRPRCSAGYIINVLYPNSCRPSVPSSYLWPGCSSREVATFSSGKRFRARDGLIRRIIRLLSQIVGVYTGRLVVHDLLLPRAGSRGPGSQRLHDSDLRLRR